jgi:hypothetical protein
MSSSALASSSRIPASSSQNRVSRGSTNPPPSTVRYVCTVSQSCKQTFDNYNNWAQHETNTHQVPNIQDEARSQQLSKSSNVNKITKSQERASEHQKADALQRSNAQQKAIALQKADALASTYDIWYCDGVDGCTEGWFKEAGFECHFREKHTMGWNKLPRSMFSSDYLLGPVHGVRLWCGFCKMVMEVSSKEKWHYDRLQHVASVCTVREHEQKTDIANMC